MLAAILGFFTALPKLIDAINALVGALNAHAQAMRESNIAQGQSDMNKAKTGQEIHDAAKENSSALSHL